MAVALDRYAWLETDPHDPESAFDTDLQQLEQDPVLVGDERQILLAAV